MMRWILCCFVLLGGLGGRSLGWAAPPLSQLIRFVDEEPDKAFPLLRKELERSDLSAALRAQYLQLLALAYYNKVQKGRAKDVFRQSLKIDPDVPLRGEMSPLMRQQFLLWRKEFLLHHPVRRRPPPPSRSPDLVPSIVLLSIGAAAFVGAAVLGVVALSERDAAEKAYNKLPTAALHFRNADGLALGANLAYATGGALLVASTVWLIVELTKSPPSRSSNHPPHATKERILW